jgi:hypothetical protein
MGRPSKLDARLSEIFVALRRMLSALRGRLFPGRPEPVPVRVKNDG